MKYMLILILSVLVSGCASNQYGNHLKSEISHAVIRDDVLSLLTERYPPAVTELSLVHAINKKDRFGSSLINEMRQQGYAVHEFGNETSRDVKEFAYTLDYIENFYRITLYVDETRLSRAYVEESGEHVPLSGWSVTE